MDYQVSARKYRPGTFDDVIGQSHVVQTLMNSIATKRIAHAFLFSGTRGVGKTTVARILAKALNCEQGPTGTPCNTCANCQEITQGTSVDVVEIDGASNTSVDDVREIRENVKFTPFRGQYRVYIIDEVHMLSNSAFNALLKTLEEPPSHVVFIFATTEIHKIPATILSRCQHYNFRRISKAEIVQRLRHVADQDGLTIEDRSLMALARASEGSMRDGLSLLDQIIAFGGNTIRHEDLEALLGAVPQERIRAMVEAVIQQDSAKALQVIAALLDQGHDVRAYCADLVEYVRNMLVAAVVPSGPELRSLIEATEEDLTQLARDAERFTVEQLQELFRMYAAAEDSLRVSAHPRFVLETAAVRATRLLRTAEVQPASSRLAVQPEKPAADRRVVTQTPAQTQDKATPSPAPVVKTTGVKVSQDNVAKTSAAGGGTPKAPSVAPPREVAAPPARTPAVAPSAPVVPPASAAPVQQEPKATSAAEASAAAVEVNWEQFQEAVSTNHPNIAPFLEMGRLVKIEGGLITLGFAKQATTARSMLEKEDNLQALAALGESLYGCAVRIRIVEVAEQDPGAAPTMKQIRVAKEQEQRLILTQQAKAHPLVKQALEMFGGELAEVRTTAPAQEVQE
ncbi:MAG: DNA polymerase III subunit gamma/tau [Nitrospira sp.]|jgi:DNA polymerase-3 subunit gamma/tau|uniref:DNA polymerase III subunit gamma/tau n=1 Tax=Nitrospira sp. ND1 TaxID=1658518 RepID=UPI0009B996B6|nr:DNA polymerase III subunit gamma/tau [Nitrospira sp. ND1]MBK7418519.1 DNA polymerase III subunit gamma/tau [Nitrospira sp.]MBK7485045.1 DNA polymerase III subunit gamma/tau [Nitrospira sp.]MBK9998337.1 DNA polymerase III subunit gamma/tau [Nitrospira sp.]MBP6201025.1 DNA polymerase III subunit gamma/tau [Nitrospira sp.]MBP6205253.1 DNA polymerase III subunit gamma/tau [Nitrospira sp.]